jgi:glycosyl transferase family 1
MRRLRILTWHTHGSYLYYLSQLPHDFYVLSKPGRPPGYAGRAGLLPWGDNVIDLPVDAAREQPLDCILFQDDHQYLDDQFRYLDASQRALPRIYIEHDPPREHPTDTRHPVDDAGVLVVHVTAFNRLMWDCGSVPTTVIEHGVVVPSGPGYKGTLPRGVVVVNDLVRRGRRLGSDVFAAARDKLPLDLVGMGATECGGLGEVPHAELGAFLANYRFFFNPIRYTSLGLAVIEAMMIGLPVVALATTELVTVLRNEESGFLHTDPAVLHRYMRALLADPDAARAVGERGRQTATARFSIGRFVDDWNRTLLSVCR